MVLGSKILNVENSAYFTKSPILTVIPKWPPNDSPSADRRIVSSQFHPGIEKKQQNPVNPVNPVEKVPPQAAKFKHFTSAYQHCIAVTVKPVPGFYGPAVSSHGEFNSGKCSHQKEQ